MTWIAGEIISQGYPYTARPVPKSAAAITRGQVVCADVTTHLWRTAVATDVRPFGVAIKDAAAADTFANDIIQNAGFEMTVVAGGAIQPFTYVKAGALGVVVAWVQGTDSVELRIGQYLGTEGHMDGHTAPVAAALNDIICIRRTD
jgi:hypothetical protein